MGRCGQINLVIKMKIDSAGLTIQNVDRDSDKAPNLMTNIYTRKILTKNILQYNGYEARNLFPDML